MELTLSMPLPVGHTLLGYAVHEGLLLSDEKKRFSWRMILFFVFLANLADFDFLPGFLIGQPNLYHRHFWSHSIGGSVAVGFLFAILFYWKGWGRFGRCFVVFTMVYFSHVALDFWGVDTLDPVGVPMFWPINSEYIMAPFSLFMSVHKSGESGNFIQSLLVPHNFIAAGREALVVLPMLAIVKIVQVRKQIIARLVQKN